MDEKFAIQLFEGKKVRIVWDAEQEKYYFAVADIVQVLTDTVNPQTMERRLGRSVVSSERASDYIKVIANSDITQKITKR